MTPRLLRVLAPMLLIVPLLTVARGQSPASQPHKTVQHVTWSPNLEKNLVRVAHSSPVLA
jgi:hypothetical protein